MMRRVVALDELFGKLREYSENVRTQLSEQINRRFTVSLPQISRDREYNKIKGAAEQVRLHLICCIAATDEIDPLYTVYLLLPRKSRRGEDVFSLCHSHFNF